MDININTMHQLTKDDAITVINFIKRNNSVNDCNGVSAKAQANGGKYIIELGFRGKESSGGIFLVNKYMDFNRGVELDFLGVSNLDDVLALINELGLIEFKVEV